MTPLDLLSAWISRQAEPQGVAWLEQQRVALRSGPTARMLAITTGLAPRKVGKGPLALSADDLAAAEMARPGWRPLGLSLEQAARLVLLLEAAAATNDFPALLKSVLTTSDLAEQIAVFRGLPLYPNPQGLTMLAIEGHRSAVQAVFESVAHNNPYPAEQFSQDQWNQMVLKALFIGAQLDPIFGLDHRWNAELTRMLIGYAAERSAAARPISPELWRGVGPHADAAAIDRLAEVLASRHELERQGAALALASAGDAGRRRLEAEAPDLARAVAAQEIGWKGLADRLKSS